MWLFLHFIVNQFENSCITTRNIILIDKDLLHIDDKDLLRVDVFTIAETINDYQFTDRW